MQLTTRVDLLPADAVNNPDRPMWGGKPRWITIHETDNPSVGANAEMHRRFVLGGGGPDTASFHAVCDDRESIQLLPWTAAAYHVGDGDGGEGNNTSVGIELCVNADGDYAKTVDRGARLTAALLQTFGLGIEAVRQHGSWWSPANPAVHRGCPRHLKADDLGMGWDDFLAAVLAKLAPPAPAPAPAPNPAAWTCPQTGKVVLEPFLGYYRANGADAALGLPISPELGEPWASRVAHDVARIQYFQRARLEKHADGSITRGLIGAELARLNGIPT